MSLRGLVVGGCLWLIAAPALAALGKNEIRELEDLLARIGFDPGPVDSEWCVGYHFIDVATALDRSHTLIHGEYRATLVAHHRFISVNTHQQVVTVSSGLSEEVHMTVMEQIGHHIDVHACDVRFSWLASMHH